MMILVGPIYVQGLVMHFRWLTYKCYNRVVAFLNQVHAWFLEIAFVRHVGVCVCVCACVCVRPRGYKLHSHDI